jgi:hypothetical protein
MNDKGRELWVVDEQVAIQRIRNRRRHAELVIDDAHADVVLRIAALVVVNVFIVALLGRASVADDYAMRDSR